MKDSVYKIALSDGDWGEAHFELRTSPDNRPFHMVFRRHSEELVLNAMHDGEWGEEERHPLPALVPQIKTFRIELRGSVIDAYVAEQHYRFEMQGAEGTNGLLAFGAHTTWTFEPLTADTSAPAIKEPAPADAPMPPTSLKIAGQTLTLPKTLAPAFVSDLAHAIENDPGSYMQFMTAHPLGNASRKLTILDIEPNTSLFAFVGKILLPYANVLKLTASDDEQRNITALAMANKISGMQSATHDDIIAELRDGTGPVLLQGGLAFEAFGDILDALPEDRRTDISFWTAAQDIVPGHRVFPCANASIWTPPNWTLKHNAAIDLSGRRPGIDVTVAAYNAGEYLIECAESLLCEGRDDVRVIIVDDGSSDGSGEMAAAHFKDEDRVRVEPKPNGGCASARNYGRLVSDATHIAFVDADDFVTPGFFGDLYDLALYSGCEMTQAGFDFYDESLEEPYYPSYEEEIFKDIPRGSFKGQPLIHLQSADIIKGQPTIWRKVYRRDFLDTKNIYFPENVRAYDDYIFQMFTLTAARNLLMLPEHKYHYRQHPAQDIKQGDERHFYMIFMFQMLLKRSVAEGWPNFRPYAESIIDCISWSSSVLKPDLVDSFLLANARFCVGMSKTYGPETIEDLIHRVGHPDFAYHYRAESEKFKDIPPGPFWTHFNGELYHPDIVRMRQDMLKAN